MLPLIRVSEEKVSLEGPWECPFCGGHYSLDASYLESMDEKYLQFSCLYCDSGLCVPNEEEE